MDSTIASGAAAIKRTTLGRLLRLRAILRRLSPVFAFVALFITAQAGTLLLPTSAFAVFALVAWRTVAVRCVSIYSSALLAGVMSALLLHTNPAAIPSGEQLYRAEILDGPRYRSAGAVQLTLRLTLANAVSDGQSWSAICRGPAVPWNELGSRAEDLNPGTLLLVRTKLQGHSDKTVGYNATLRRHGIDATCKLPMVALVRAAPPSLIQRLRSKLYNTVYSSVGEGEDAGLLLSLALGKRDTLTLLSERAFKRCGIAHLLVLSGYQVMLVYIAVRWCSRWVLRRFFVSALQRGVIGSYWAAAIASIFTALFVAVVGAESASMRALIAAGALVVAVVWERGGGMLNAMLLALLLLSIGAPGCYFEPGVQLTFAALAGIALGISARGASRMQKFLMSTILASLFSGAVSMLWFDSFSIIGVLANLVIVPVVSIIACHGGLTGVIASLIWPNAGALILQIVAWILDQFRLGVIAVSHQQYIAIDVGVTGKIIVCAVVCSIGLAVLYARFKTVVAMRGVRMGEW